MQFPYEEMMIQWLALTIQTTSWKMIFWWDWPAEDAGPWLWGEENTGSTHGWVQSPAAFPVLQWEELQYVGWWMDDCVATLVLNNESEAISRRRGPIFSANADLIPF